MKKLLFRKSKAALEGLSSQALGAIIGIIAIVGLVYLYNDTSSKNDVISLKEGLLHLNAEINALFNGQTGYEDLTNDIVLEAQIVPSDLRKGKKLINPFGGEINLYPSGDGSSFFIEVTEIPDKECIQLTSDQNSSWKSITVNNTELSKDKSSVETINLCTNSNNNTLKYESR